MRDHLQIKVTDERRQVHDEDGFADEESDSGGSGLEHGDAWAGESQHSLDLQKGSGRALSREAEPVLLSNTACFGLSAAANDAHADSRGSHVRALPASDSVAQRRNKLDDIPDEEKQGRRRAPSTTSSFLYYRIGPMFWYDTAQDLSSARAAPVRRSLDLRIADFVSTTYLRGQRLVPVKSFPDAYQPAGVLVQVAQAGYIVCLPGSLFVFFTFLSLWASNLQTTDDRRTTQGLSSSPRDERDGSLNEDAIVMGVLLNLLPLLLLLFDSHLNEQPLKLQHWLYYLLFFMKYLAFVVVCFIFDLRAPCDCCAGSPEMAAQCRDHQVFPPGCRAMNEEEQATYG
ncbi:unnamed protein product, partial [Amoebophrya sp. A120]|eukprot:GSA120T00004256001.1